MERFSKIRWDEKDVTLEWTTDSGTATHAHELLSHEAPHKEFESALRALASDVIAICEVGWSPEDVVVRSVALSTNAKSGRRGVVVSALKSVDVANSPLVLQTPHLSEDAGDDTGGEKKGVVPEDMWKRILTLEGEARKYLEGKRAPRAQTEMPLGDPQPAGA